MWFFVPGLTVKENKRWLNEFNLEKLTNADFAWQFANEKYIFNIKTKNKHLYFLHF